MQQLLGFSGVAFGAPTLAFLGPSEIIVVLVIALLVFGPERLPQIGRQIGQMKRQIDHMKDDLHRTIDDLNSYVPYETPRYEPPYGPTYPQIADSQTNHDGQHWVASAEEHAASLNATPLATEPPPGPPSARSAAMQVVGASNTVARGSLNGDTAASNGESMDGASASHHNNKEMA